MSTVKFIQGHIPIVPFFFQLTDTHHNYHKNEKIYEITNNTTKKIKSFSSHISSLPRISQFREKEKTENNLIFPKNLTKRKKIQYSNIKKENSFIYQQNFDNLNSLQEISISDLNKNKFWQQVLEHKILNENNSHRKTMKQINSFCTNEKKIEKNYLKKKEDLYFEKRELMTRKSLYSSNIHVKFHRNQNSLSLQDQEYLELNILSQKIMKRIRKILKMNTNNISKTYFELIKIVDNKKLNELLFWERHKKINPKLNESFILRSLFIAPITYNSPNQERLEKNEVN